MALGHPKALPEPPSALSSPDWELRLGAQPCSHGAPWVQLLPTDQPRARDALGTLGSKINLLSGEICPALVCWQHSGAPWDSGAEGFLGSEAGVDGNSNHPAQVPMFSWIFLPRAVMVL